MRVFRFCLLPAVTAATLLCFSGCDNTEPEGVPDAPATDPGTPDDTLDTEDDKTDVDISLPGIDINVDDDSSDPKVDIQVDEDALPEDSTTDDTVQP